MRGVTSPRRAVALASLESAYALNALGEKLYSSIRAYGVMYIHARRLIKRLGQVSRLV